MLIGYMRVSTDEQNFDLQRDALERAKCERIYDAYATKMRVPLLRARTAAGGRVMKRPRRDGQQGG